MFEILKQGHTIGIISHAAATGNLGAQQACGTGNLGYRASRKHAQSAPKHLLVSQWHALGLKEIVSIGVSKCEQVKSSACISG